LNLLAAVNVTASDRTHAAGAFHDARDCAAVLSLELTD
jgi:hypothetical protein